jgi:LPS-assembly protein
MDASVSFSSSEARCRVHHARAALPALAWAVFGALILWLGLLPSAIAAPTPPAQPAAEAAKPADKLVIEADELVYDKDKNTVTATGSVQLFYKGRVLQADRVIYDRNTKRVYAEGHAKMTDERGDIVYGSRFELSDDFRQGFIDSVQLLTSDKTRFTSPRVERNGDVTVLNEGAYTACEPCKNHPDWPPFWQVRAARIIENQETHTIYFEDAQMLFWGVPLFYMPYFSAPDPTVNKKTGLLAPSFVSGANLGYGVSWPYFINLAPNYDLTLIPTYLSKQGLLGEVDWRQRLSNGQYSIRATGIDEQQPNVFPVYPYGAGDQRLRGSVETKGNFFLNQDWQFGWNATWLSDKFYANDYRLQGIDFSNYYFQDVVSSIYLRGQADHSFFDLSAYHFEGATANDDNHTLPEAVPVLDYNRVFDVPADRSNGIGGQATIDVNIANIDQTNAAFQSTGLQTFDNAYHLYNVCETTVGGKYVNTYYPGACMLRSIAGDYTRASGQASWQRSYIDPIGEVWKPFVFARLDGESTELNETGSITYASSIGSSTVANSSQAAFFSGGDQGSFARGMAGVGLEYQYPFTMSSSWGSQTITPIGQFIVRPSEVIPSIQPNEDAQSLVFDETNLFAWNKFSGYDRIEGGTRLNYGMQYTANFANGGHADVIGGESIQVAGQNSYTLFDVANTGLESGLDKTFSNFVAGETLQPTSAPVSLISKQQFDSTTFQLDRFDAIAKANVAGVNASLDYALYAAQPALGWEYPREGLTGSASYNFLERWSVNGSLVLDMSRHYYDTAGQETPIFYPIGYSFGFGYKDDCTTFTLKYSSSLSAPAAYPIYAGGPVIYNPAVRAQTLIFQLTLRTLGDLKGNVGL